MNLYLPVQLLAIHAVFAQHGIPHAFGGAIALAYYGQPRATYDIDINIFLPTSRHREVLDALERLFPLVDRAAAEQQIVRSAQTRILWGQIPVDLFFSELAFHDELAGRVHVENFSDATIPILSAEDLIICKAAYNRAKDWVDIADIFRVQRNRLDTAYLRHWLDDFFTLEGEQTLKVEELIATYCEPASPSAP